MDYINYKDYIKYKDHDAAQRCGKSENNKYPKSTTSYLQQKQTLPIPLKSQAGTS